MTTHEQAFLSELEVLRAESEAASQFLFAYLAIHQTARRRKRVFRALDRHALFWNTVAGALQTSAIVALGRVFDQATPHNLDVLLRVAQQAPAMFSKSALAHRKQGASPTEPLWLTDFMATVFEPAPTTFRALRAYAKKLRRVYENRFRDLRHKVFAHTVAVGIETAPITAKANINELKRLIASLLSLHQTLFDLFWNGHEPSFQPVRYSAKRRKGITTQDRPHERIVAETEEVLRAAARPNTDWTRRRGRTERAAGQSCTLGSPNRQWQ